MPPDAASTPSPPRQLNEGAFEYSERLRRVRDYVAGNLERDVAVTGPDDLGL